MTGSSSRNEIEELLTEKFSDLAIKDKPQDEFAILDVLSGSAIETSWVPRYDWVRMIGILFAPEGTQLTQKQIRPRLKEYHYRSGNHADFFCAGYDFSWRENSGTEISFDERLFNEFREDIQRQTTWKYSGNVDLLLLNSHLNKDTDKAGLDFTTTVVCQLDKMIEDKAIHNIGEFFESIFQFTEKHDGSDPTWGFSDNMGLEAGKGWLVSLVLSLLPAKLGDHTKKAAHFAVHDVSRTA